MKKDTIKKEKPTECWLFHKWGKWVQYGPVVQLVTSRYKDSYPPAIVKKFNNTRRFNILR